MPTFAHVTAAKTAVKRTVLADGRGHGGRAGVAAGPLRRCRAGCVPKPSAASIGVVVFQARRRLGTGGRGDFSRHGIYAAEPSGRGGEDFFLSCSPVNSPDWPDSSCAFCLGAPVRSRTRPRDFTASGTTAIGLLGNTNLVHFRRDTLLRLWVWRQRPGWCIAVGAQQRRFTRWRSCGRALHWNAIICRTWWPRLRWPYHWRFWRKGRCSDPWNFSLATYPGRGGKSDQRFGRGRRRNGLKYRQLTRLRPNSGAPVRRIFSSSGLRPKVRCPAIPPFRRHPGQRPAVFAGRHRARTRVADTGRRPDARRRRAYLRRSYLLPGRRARRRAGASARGQRRGHPAGTGSCLCITGASRPALRWRH